MAIHTYVPYIQADNAWKVGERGTAWAGGGGVEKGRGNGGIVWQENVRVLNVNQGGRAPPHKTLGIGETQNAKGGRRLAAAWVREEEKAPKNWRRVEEAEEEGTVEVVVSGQRWSDRLKDLRRMPASVE